MLVSNVMYVHNHQGHGQEKEVEKVYQQLKHLDQRPLTVRGYFANFTCTKFALGYTIEFRHMLLNNVGHVCWYCSFCINSSGAVYL